MPDWKKFWNDTSSEISGIVVLAVLLMVCGLVNYSWFLASHPASSMKYAFAAAIGGVLTYKLVRHRQIKLDSERTIAGKQAIVVGIVSGILFIESAIFALMTWEK